MKSLLFLWFVSGCAYRVTLISSPTPANVELPNGDRVSTPADVSLRWVPFGHQRIVATATGYRPIEVDLRKTEVRSWRLLFGPITHPQVLNGAPRGEVQLLLVPEHGPVGSWTEEDIP